MNEDLEQRDAEIGIRAELDELWQRLDDLDRQVNRPPTPARALRALWRRVKAVLRRIVGQRRDDA